MKKSKFVLITAAIVAVSASAQEVNQVAAIVDFSDVLVRSVQSKLELAEAALVGDVVLLEKAREWDGVMDGITASAAASYLALDDAISSGDAAGAEDAAGAIEDGKVAAATPGAEAEGDGTESDANPVTNVNENPSDTSLKKEIDQSHYEELWNSGTSAAAASDKRDVTPQ